MVHLDFVTVHDRLEGGAREELAETLQRIQGDHSIDYATEELLQMERSIQDAIPRGAVLYVHGHFRNGYRNIGLVRTFATQRPDLRFILNIDPFKAQERHFDRGIDYRSTLFDPIENSLEAYVQQWQKLQEALR